MIVVTRLNGKSLWINPFLIESVESTPDSVVTLNNGHKYIVLESPEEITKQIVHLYRQIGIVGSGGAGEEGRTQ